MEVDAEAARRRAARAVARRERPSDLLREREDHVGVLVDRVVLAAREPRAHLDGHPVLRRAAEERAERPHAADAERARRLGAAERLDEVLHDAASPAGPRGQDAGEEVVGPVPVADDDEPRPAVRGRRKVDAAHAARLERPRRGPGRARALGRLLVRPARRPQEARSTNRHARSLLLPGCALGPKRRGAFPPAVASAASTVLNAAWERDYHRPAWMSTREGAVRGARGEGGPIHLRSRHDTAGERSPGA